MSPKDAKGMANSVDPDQTARSGSTLFAKTYEPRHDKTSKVTVRPAKTQISLGIRPV